MGRARECRQCGAGAASGHAPGWRVGARGHGRLNDRNCAYLCGMASGCFGVASRLHSAASARPGAGPAAEEARKTVIGCDDSLPTTDEPATQRLFFVCPAVALRPTATSLDRRPPVPACLIDSYGHFEGHEAFPLPKRRSCWARTHCHLVSRRIQSPVPPPA